LKFFSRLSGLLIGNFENGFKPNKLNGGFIMKINTSKYGFNFFLSGKKQVTNLEAAAKEYGGATLNLDTDEMYSNVPGNQFIELKKDWELNTLSVFIPSTDGVYEQADKEKIKKVVSVVIGRVYRKYESVPTIEKGLGSYQADDGGIAYDNLIIASVHLEKVEDSDIKFFVKLGQYIKKEMKQESVSLCINDALALI
jgi:hypothetical protein